MNSWSPWLEAKVDCSLISATFPIATLSYTGRQLLKIELCHSAAERKRLSHKNRRGRGQSTSLKNQVRYAENTSLHSISMKQEVIECLQFVKIPNFFTSQEQKKTSSQLRLGCCSITKPLFSFFTRNAKWYIIQKN